MQFMSDTFSSMSFDNKEVNRNFTIFNLQYMRYQLTKKKEKVRCNL